jgi:hypothetical protein
MPGGFPLSGEICNGVNVNVTPGVYVVDVPGGGANALGSWTQIIGSTSIDCVEMHVFLGGFIHQGPNAAISIGVGAGGSEKNVVNNLMIAGANANGAYFDVHRIPVLIPAGTKISAQCQTNSAIAGDGASVALILFDGAFTQSEGFAGVDAIGFLPASTSGTQLDPGAVVNTKGSYAILTTSTLRDYAALFFAFDCRGQTSASGTHNDNFTIDIAIGASGSEKIIIPDFGIIKNYVSAQVQINTDPLSTEIFFVPIPAGTQIQARAQCSTNTATERLIGITAYGLY